MAAASTVEARGRQQVAELLHRTAKWLHAEQQHQRWQTIVVRRLGGLARLGGFAELEATAQRMLLDAPASAFWSGVITNLPDLTVLVRRELPDDAALAMEFPEYVGDVALKFVRGEFAPHIQLTLEGRLTEAADHVTNERYAEEYASTCAVLGHLDAALAFIERPDFPASRKSGPLIVACVEGHRLGQDVLTRQLLARFIDDDRERPWHWLFLAAGFLDRVPWGGYPYPDY
jgi:hypothetical protein